MIDTFFASGALNAPWGFVAALIIGILFGVVLESVGFGNAKRLNGVFYLRDMVVFKFMLPAMTTAVIGYTILWEWGFLVTENTYLMPTVYGAYIVGGILFGVGFAVSGWCPGTAVVGFFTGKYDAGIFIIGVIVGSILFNELFPVIEPLYGFGDVGVQYIWASLGISRGVAVIALSMLTIATLFVCEWIDRRDETLPFPGDLRTFGKNLWSVGRASMKSSRVFSILVWALIALPFATLVVTGNDSAEQQLLAKIADAEDHIEPEALARRLIEHDDALTVVDVRPRQEYEQFHLKGARNIALSDLHRALRRYKNRGDIVLYSNGMTHPAQARDSLQRSGFDNAYMLTDGLNGFIDRCLTPVSLRGEPVPASYAEEINAWRAFFLEGQFPHPTSL